MNEPSETVVVGRITTVFGVRGWVKVHSHTELKESLFSYQPWWINRADGWRLLVVDDWRKHGDSFVAHLRGIDDRDEARAWCQQDVRVEKSQLPSLESEEYYWHQLEGLTVITHFEGREIRLGVVKSLLETGANDVLVVQGDAKSIDAEERLIPYIDQFVMRVDLQEGQIEVDWDPSF